MSPFLGLEQDAERVCALARGRMGNRRRTIVAIAGPPASGKSTLAERVVQRLNRDDDGCVPTAALLPMDGYHLDNRLLQMRGLLSRKGSPESFDAQGFCAAVKGLLSATEETFHPRFDRQADMATAGAIAIHPKTPIVVTEGNYLFLKSEPWSRLHDCFAVTIFLLPAMDVLRDRLLRRWIDHGLDPEAGLARVTENDLVNADLVIRESRAADVRINPNDAER